MTHFLKSRSEQGQGLVEYALILVLVAVVVIAVLLLLGPAVRQVYSTVLCQLDLSSDIRGVVAQGDPSNLTLTVYTRRSTTLTISGDASGGGACSGECSYNFTGLPNSGEIVIEANQGCTIYHRW